MNEILEELDYKNDSVGKHSFNKSKSEINPISQNYEHESLFSPR